MTGLQARRLVAAMRMLATLAAVVLLSRSAAAVGTVTISPKDVQEVDGKWKINMTVNYGSMPLLPHVPVIFEFTQTVHWERALTDKSPDKPVIVKTPLQNQQPINESMDIGFSDPMGKIFQTTKFDFLIRRDRGFEAGEYSLKIKRESDGVVLGQPQKLTLNGDNPIVDRRAIVFSGEKKKKSSSGDSASGDKGSGDADKDKKPAGNEAGSTEGAGAKSDEPGGEPGAANEPPAVPPKQGGCGCRVGAEDVPAHAPVAFLALAAALAVRRVRERRRASSAHRS